MANVVRGLVGLLLAVIVAWAPALAADHSLLVGTWELSHDPEGNPRIGWSSRPMERPRASHPAGGELPANTP
jgi:hypothetical protein